MLRTLIPAVHRNRGAKRAREARARLGLERAAPIGCLLTAVEGRAGVPVVVGRWGGDALGCCLRTDGTHVLWIRSGEPPVRQRFTLAHELGHVCCEHDGSVPAETSSTLNDKGKSAIEVEANAFAAEILVPKVAILELLPQDPSLEQICILASTYGVSAIVVLIRLQTCGRSGEEHNAEMRTRIDAQEHLELLRELVPPMPDDVIARLEPDPETTYLSPAVRGSTLASILSGDCSVTDAALHLGTTEEELDLMLDGLGITTTDRD